MKYAFLFSIAFLFFSSCNSPSSEQADDAGQNETTEVSTPPEKAQNAKPAYLDIDIMQFKKRMDQPDVVIIDVRTPEEIAGGKITGAIEIDYNDPSFDEKIQALDKEKIYLVYCQSGIRSAAACEKMADQGFKRLNNFKGGYGAWVEGQ